MFTNHRACLTLSSIIIATIANHTLLCTPAHSQSCETQWSPLGKGTGTVYALTVFDDGNGPLLYVAGCLTHAGGQPAKGIAKWDGSDWMTIDEGIDDGTVFALTVFDDGTGPALYVGGNFTSVAGQPTHRIARWDGADWTPLGSGMNHHVHALAVFDDGAGPALYAGGSFTSAGGQSVNRIAKWNGSQWSPVGAAQGTVEALAVFDDGSGPALYVGGEFWDEDLGGDTDFLGRWDGTNFSTFQSGPNHNVAALATFDDGTGTALYVGGRFTIAGGQSANMIAKWNGSTWSSLSSGMNESATVSALAVFNDGGGPALYAGGLFNTAGGQVAHDIARWSGGQWSPLGEGITGSGWVHALAVFTDEAAPAMYAGGSFTMAGGEPAQGIARWGCPHLIDTDGDGIPDDWEINGVPYVDSEGKPQRYMLPGANPMRKDLYVEVDVMERPFGKTVPFSLTSLAAVEQAFLFAPVSNPDGSTGITLHLLVDDLEIPHVALIDEEVIFNQLRPQWFGTNSERNDPEAAAILAAKAKVYRYCVFVDRMFMMQDEAVRHLLGIAEAAHAATFAVSLGGMERSVDEIERYLGSTFMHELGHALGLQHGGGDDIHYKPNYVSVMNYNFDELRYTSTVPGELGPRLDLDFSREVLLPLNEASLDENLGVLTQFHQDVWVPHAFRIPGETPQIAHVVLGSGAHDWNGDNRIESGVVVDLNWLPANHTFASHPSPGQIMNGFNDWLLLNYAVPPVREGGGASHGCAGSACVCRYSEELLAWHEKNIPPPPVCAVADLNCDGVVDISDLLILLGNWGPCPDPDACPADLNGDGAVDVSDLLILLANWG